MTRTLASTFALLVSVAPLAAQGGTWGGIYFPQGAASFADRVLRYDPTYDPNGCAPSKYLDPNQALGTPTGSPSVGYLSLGEGGLVELEFLDNVLASSGDAQPDLHVFEIGSRMEATFVAIRPADAATLAKVTATNPGTGSPYLADANGDGFFEIGLAPGQTTSIDIDVHFAGSGYAAGELTFDAVQLIDDIGQTSPCPNAGGTSTGADIDAVGAVSTQAAPYPGSGEDLFLFTAINAATPTTGPGSSVKSATAADFIVLRLESPGTVFFGDPPVVLVQVFPTGMPPAGSLPSLHIDLTQPFGLLIDGTVRTPVGWAQVIGPGGVSSAVRLPPGLAGLSVLLQGGVLSAAARNGAYALTDAHEVQVQ